jgi:hypothetical protein
MVPPLSRIFMIREAGISDEDEIKIDLYHLRVGLETVQGWESVNAISSLNTLVSAFKSNDIQGMRKARGLIAAVIARIPTPRAKATAQRDFEHLQQVLVRMRARANRGF